jgi:tetratricopeptide (TPR) repeat protein
MKNLIKKLTLASILVLIFQTGVMAQVDRAIDAAKRGDYTTALNLFKSAGNVGGDYDANYWYGRTLFETGSVNDAQKYFQAALKDDDEGWEALMGMGDLLSYQGKYDDANNYYKRAAKENDENVDILVAQGRNLAKADKLEDALVPLTKATTLKKTAEVYTGLGDVYFYGGAIPAALDNYNKALGIKPNYGPAQYGIGNVYFEQKKYQDAVEMYQKAVQSSPNFADAYLQLGKLLYFNEDYQAALSAINKYNQLKPGDLDGLSYGAKIMVALQQYNEANALLDEVLAIDPNNASAFKYKGYVLASQEQYDQAITNFQKVPADMMEVDDYIMFAETYEKKGDYTSAYEVFRKGSVSDTASARLELEWGESYLNNKQFEDALVHFSRAEELGNNTAIIYKGLTYFNLAKYTEAVAEFDKAIIVNDEYALNYLLRGNAKEALGDKSGAMADYEKVLQLEPGNTDAQERLEFLRSEGDTSGTTNTPEGQ